MTRLFTGILLYSLAAFCPVRAMDPASPDILEAKRVFEINNCMGKVWPRYRINKPILIYFKDVRRSILISHPAPPEGFSPCPGSGKVPLYCGRRELPPTRSDFALSHRVNGVDTVFYAVRDIFDPLPGRQLLFHESFHEFQEKDFFGPRRFFDPYRPKPEEEALIRMENLALLRALLSRGREQSGYVRDFISLREKRRKNFPSDTAREGYKERIEGSAQYVDIMSSADPCGDRRDNFDLPAFITRDMLFLLESFANGENYYFSAAAQMVILDSLRIPWQDRLRGGETIYPILREYFPGERRDPRKLKERYGYSGIMGRIAAGSGQEESDAAEILEGPALTVTVPAAVSAAGPQSHGEFKVLGSGRTFYFSANLEIFPQRGFSFHVEGLPMMIAPSDDPVQLGRSLVYPNKYKVFLENLSGVEIKIDGKMFAPSEKAAVFSSMAVSAPGIALKSSSPGKVRRSGMEIHIAFDNNPETQI